MGVMGLLTWAGGHPVSRQGCWVCFGEIPWGACPVARTEWFVTTRCLGQERKERERKKRRREEERKEGCWKMHKAGVWGLLWGLWPKPEHCLLSAGLAAGREAVPRDCCAHELG